ncbi:uncharacterized protein LOC103521141 isoform X2 [Diaphorina citri]|uniref:Uncharacterized protein LOC103521141 isoform X2 n=1 Tax=Diaphorina citri TaxID=121845 RepID=A0A1S3DLT8_DIACI|nr:uncharacterized protein LOC103521141 isoform X2 [Diaphorina citri]
MTSRYKVFSGLNRPSTELIYAKTQHNYMFNVNQAPVSQKSSKPSTVDVQCPRSKRLRFRKTEKLNSEQISTNEIECKHKSNQNLTIIKSNDGYVSLNNDAKASSLSKILIRTRRAKAFAKKYKLKLKQNL